MNLNAAKFHSRSIGLKLIVVCVLALVMSVPALFVGSLVDDRARRAEAVTEEISRHVGGRQTFLGPTMAIPYIVAPPSPNGSARRGVYRIFPFEATASVKTATEERRRSLFRVPVYRAELKLKSAFDLTRVPSAAPQGAVLDWSRAEIQVGVSDARGALADAVITMGGKSFALTPTQMADEEAADGGRKQRMRLTMLATQTAELLQPNMRFEANAALRFSGAERISVLAYGKTTRLTVEGDWPNPGFDGGFLPANRRVSGSGFTAEWLVPYIARGVRAEGPTDTLTGIDATSLGVTFVEVADPYQSVNRSLKYALLFLGLVFLSYLIFEMTAGRRVHPAQYVLVGIAQSVFYLLLLSMAERIGFDSAFLMSGAATVLLLAANAMWIFESRLQGVRALVCFSLLYGLIYVLLRLEDNALLAGAIASFVAVAALMYLTRGIDWYGRLENSGVAE